MPDGQGVNDLCHRVFLIRHGETVDNVAGLYAGVRDSVLTNHGVQQALRLGDYFAKQGIRFSNIYSSNLQRAFKTAKTICAAQKPKATDGIQPTLTVVQVRALQEQDFGFYEGKPFYARTTGSPKSGKDQHRAEHRAEEGFQDVETKESMARRADSFLDEFLSPLLAAAGDEPLTIAVVSHGILLSSLWKCMLRRQARNTVHLTPSLLETAKPLSLEHLGGWSNTGYLELELRRHVKEPQIYPAPTAMREAAATLETVHHVPFTLRDQPAKSEVLRIAAEGLQAPTISKAAIGGTAKGEIIPKESSAVPCPAVNMTITIVTINGKEHLKGLKRTGGGVGSSKFDAGQKSIDTFFKRQRTE